MKISATKHRKKPNKFDSQKKAQTQILLTKNTKREKPKLRFCSQKHEKNLQIRSSNSPNHIKLLIHEHTRTHLPRLLHRQQSLQRLRLRIVQLRQIQYV